MVYPMAFGYLLKQQIVVKFQTLLSSHSLLQVGLILPLEIRIEGSRVIISILHMVLNAQIYHFVS